MHKFDEVDLTFNTFAYNRPWKLKIEMTSKSVRAK